MAKKLVKLGIERDSDFIYYIDKNGDVARAPRRGKSGKKSVVAKVGLKREKGFLYFVDAAGDISCAPMKKS